MYGGGREVALEPGYAVFVPPVEEHHLSNAGDEVLGFVCFIPMMGIGCAVGLIRTDAADHVMSVVEAGYVAEAGLSRASYVCSPSASSSAERTQELRLLPQCIIPLADATSTAEKRAKSEPLPANANCHFPRRSLRMTSPVTDKVEPVPLPTDSFLNTKCDYFARRRGC